MTCPFPPCRWYGQAIEQQARFGDPETNHVIPIHDVKGDGFWFGRCPGSSLIVPNITDAGRSVIVDGMAAYERMARERMQKTAEEAARNLPDRREGESLMNYFIRRDGERVPLPNTDGIADLIRKHGARVDPRVELNDYFPGRPGDPIEPGTGDDQALPVPTHADVTPLGKAGQQMDNAKDNLNALIAACGAGIDSYIEDLTRVLGQIELAQSLRAVADVTAMNTQQLMIVTLGTEQAGSPQAARDMIAMTRLSRTTLSGSGAQSVIQGLAAAHEAIAAALNQAQAARTNATAYLAMPK